MIIVVTYSENKMLQWQGLEERIKINEGQRMTSSLDTIWKTLKENKKL
jgi:hypothetical protein